LLTVSFDDAEYYNTSRNVGKCGRFFYFVSSEQKLIQIDTDKINSNAFENEIQLPNTWSGAVEDFIVRKSSKDGLRDGKYVDIAILTKNKGTVYEISIDATNNAVTSREIKVSGSNELITAAGTVSYWNNIIEIEANGAPSYLINGYISTGNQNICISLGHSTFVQIPSSSKLVLNRFSSSSTHDHSQGRSTDELCGLQQGSSIYRCVGTASRWNTNTDQRVERERWNRCH